MIDPHEIPLPPDPPFRKAEARRTLLDILHEARPHAMPAPQLFIHVKARVRIITQLGFNGHLEWLSDHEMIDRLSGKFDDEASRWFITEAGEAERRR